MGRKPTEGPYRGIVGAAVAGSKPFAEVVIQREEGAAGIEAFLVFPVAALHLAVVSGRVGVYELVVDLLC